MPIVPSGKKRVMEAQSTLGMGSQWGVPDSGMSQDQAPSQEAPVEQPVQTDMQFGQEDAPQKTEEGEDLREFIMKKLEGFGYPPRRLESFSDEFVEEEIFPGGAREVTVTIPDRYYGTRKSLSDKDLTQIIEEIQAKFGLTMSSAKRSEKKAVLQFQKQPKGKAKGDEEVVQRDDLDEIFGKPKSAKPQKNEKTAQTITELVTSNRDNLFERLLSTLPKIKQEEIKSQKNIRTNILNALFEEK